MVTDLNFNIIDRNSFMMTKEHTPQLTIELIVHQLKVLMNDHHISLAQLLGIGIGAVGPLDRENGIILEPEFFQASGWRNVNIVKILKDTFPNQLVLLENGANTAALTEYYFTSTPSRNILYCISGVGLRCGVLTNGQFMKNMTGDASAFGHMIIDINDEIDSDNRTLSSYISLDSILEETIKRIEHQEKSILVELVKGDLTKINIDHLLTGLKKGDLLIQDIVMKSAYYFGIGLANIINILHPERVILSSTIIYQFPPYYQKVTDTAQKYIYRFDKENVSFELGELKEDAVSIGASVLIFDSCFQST